MKIQIRQGVFETNSNSTHSLQIIKGTAQDAKNEILKSIKDHNYGFRSKISQNGTLWLEGLECESGNECQNVYTIIESWEAKLQFITGFLYNLSYSFEDCDGTLEAFYNTATCKMLTDKAFEVSKKHGVTINNVEFDVTYYEYVDDIQGFEDFSNKSSISNDEIQNFIDTVMDDNYVITFKDEAYSPYEGFEIIII